MLGWNEDGKFLTRNIQKRTFRKLFYNNLSPYTYPNLNFDCKLGMVRRFLEIKRVRFCSPADLLIIDGRWNAFRAPASYLAIWPRHFMTLLGRNAMLWFAAAAFCSFHHGEVGVLPNVYFPAPSLLENEDHTFSNLQHTKNYSASRKSGKWWGWIWNWWFGVNW